jgi:ribonuclease E
MPNKMLIDATHPEETRVVVLRGNRVEEFDFESANRKQLRGNIYLAKVTRVEPSLQAAFVDYGGNHHGFLAFSEIHPDYYQIPVADRQALIAEEDRARLAADAEADSRAGRRGGRRERRAERPRDEIKSEPVEASDEVLAMAAGCEETIPQAGDAEHHPGPEAADETERAAEETVAADEAPPTAMAAEPPIELAQLESSASAEPVPGSEAEAPPPAEAGSEDAAASAESGEAGAGAAEAAAAAAENNITEVNSHGAESDEEVIESVGGADAMEEVPERMPRLRRQYKIQEVIKRRQVMLVQVVKEERGTKGAALTTYLSLAGRYSVLMPNTARGGGISRKITSAEDRRKLKEIAQELEVPEGMGVILRTAGAARTKTEVKRDFEYLLRLWETVRDLTLKSTAPTLVYEEGSLVKRSIRDLYNKDIDEIVVAGEDGYQDAKEFMRMLMPSHAKNVKLYRDTLPVFTRFGIESQLDAMFSPVMQLKSGGYIVLNQAEALVAIDVNSGRATREHHIEDTALKTNMEAAEEIARQLRLRDLAGLIVIDFIDMDEKRNNRAVERRLKECLRHDRARIQVGHISHFGLLEMSRQRIRSSVLESSTEKCPHCGGTGHVRSVSSVALQLLRSLEEMLLKGATHNLIVRTRAEIALYLLNHKRAHLRALEERFRITIMVNADAAIGGQLSFVIEKGEQVHSPEQAKALALQAPAVVPAEPEDEEDDEDVEEAVEAEEDEAAAEPEEARAEGERAEGERADGERGGRKRRRRRRGRRGGEGRDGGAFQPERDGAFAHDRNGGDLAREDGAFPNDRIEHQDAAARDEGHIEAEGENGQGPAEAPGEARGDSERRRRRRGRRGGRRNRRDREGEAPFASDRGRAGEPELNRAAADFDDGPATEPLHEQPMAREPIAEPQRDTPPPTAVEPQDERPAPVAVPALPDTIAPAPEPPRRRSTVREPAPVGLTGEAAAPAIAHPAEPPQPVISGPTESEDSDRPRRSGWWSKRALGKG